MYGITCVTDEYEYDSMSLSQVGFFCYELGFLFKTYPLDSAVQSFSEGNLLFCRHSIETMGSSACLLATVLLLKVPLFS